MEEIEVYSGTDELITEQICGMLDENKIVYIRKDLGIGSYINIYMGQNANMFGEKKIFVSKEDYEKAKKIIDDFLKVTQIDNEKNEENIEDEESDKSDKDVKKYAWIRRLITCLLIAMPIIVIITLIM